MKRRSVIVLMSSEIDHVGDSDGRQFGHEFDRNRAPCEIAIDVEPEYGMAGVIGPGEGGRGVVLGAVAIARVVVGRLGSGVFDAITTRQ